LRKLILAVCCICLLCILFGCNDNKYTPKKCEFCGGSIPWQRTDSTSVSDNWKLEYVQRENKDYHPWCVKIMEKSK
jgi:hypothetical protein